LLWFGGGISVDCEYMVSSGWFGEKFLHVPRVSRALATVICCTVAAAFVVGRQVMLVVMAYFPTGCVQVCVVAEMIDMCIVVISYVAPGRASSLAGTRAREALALLPRSLFSTPHSTHSTTKSLS
jgi:hypothetical protein